MVKAWQLACDHPAGYFMFGSTLRHAVLHPFNYDYSLSIQVAQA